MTEQNNQDKAKTSTKKENRKSITNALYGILSKAKINTKKQNTAKDTEQTKAAKSKADCKKELAKQFSIFSDKKNLSLGLSIIAIALSVYSLNSSSMSKAKVFLETEDNLQETTLPTLPRIESKADQAETDKFIDSLQVKNNQSTNAQVTQVMPQNNEGMYFANEEDFKRAVQKAMFQIRQDETQALMDAKFSKFANAQNTVPNGRRIYGNPQARFIIQEFSDLECPFCKDFFNTPKKVADLSNNQVAVEWIHTPLSFHEPKATQEAIAAECVFEQKGNKAFWVALQHIFDTTQGNGRGSSQLGRIVSDFGLDKSTYVDCINDPAIAKRVSDFREQAMAAGVSGTPAVLVKDTQTGRTKLLGGAQPAEAIMQAIEDLNAMSEKETVVNQ